jgi:hypothetical protein
MQKFITGGASGTGMAGVLQGVVLAFFQKAH